MSDFGQLRDYIDGAAVKRLSDVECDPTKSNQHELNATRLIRDLFGEGRAEYPARYIRLEDDEEKIEDIEGTVTIYDARESHPTRSEYRLYYQDNPAITSAETGDILAIILKKDQSVIFISAPAGSQSELELIELFGENQSTNFRSLDFKNDNTEVSISKRFILEEIGIEVTAEFGKSYLDIIQSRFGGLIFPKTRQFSALAQELAGDSNSFQTADDAIIAWWETEEAMFRQLEGELISQKLNSGFKDADDFLKFSTTIRQRRSSRAGNALENHLAQLFNEKNIRYSWEPKTEGNKKPDFLFPSIDDYRDSSFPEDRLTMLGVKTTCKDRWRQVLTEADRINNKHLFTLQPKISENQTDEMKASGLTLVVPESIKSSYFDSQKQWLLNLQDFIEHL
ncbi:type II restriction endonuclease [Gilvimarinus japonicus]|uniref:Type II restriction endonuclease n=1 Tax=Gilvimarinus japonicus TaxID=1796469 RepID=A0ABV7HSE0_9GAMM